MSIHTSSALLLRKIRFRNTSYIIDILTENRGRTTLIAKGARREKSGFFGCLDFCSLLEIVFIDKPDAMGMLTSCDVASYFAGIHRSRRRLACSMLFVRMVREFVQDRETDTGLFRVCSSFFSDIHFCDESEI